MARKKAAAEEPKPKAKAKAKAKASKPRVTKADREQPEATAQAKRAAPCPAAAHGAGVGKPRSMSEHRATRIARWLGERTGRPPLRYEKVQPGDEQRKLDALPSRLAPLE